jgi:hypothetical protein
MGVGSCGGSADDAGCGCRKSGEKSHTKRSHNGLQNVAMLKLPKAKLEPVLLQEKWNRAQTILRQNLANSVATAEIKFRRPEGRRKLAVRPRVTQHRKASTFPPQGL